MLLGQRMVGGVWSGRTVTVKQQKLIWEFAAVTVFEQQTCVTPGGKKLPDGGLQVTGTSTFVQRLVP
jgi:hypothetical protein